MEFIEYKTFSSRMEAETWAHLLDPYQVPFYIKSEDSGIFGGALCNLSATIMVPKEMFEKVKDILIRTEENF